MYNVANDVSNYHVLGCPCKASIKQFQSHVPSKEMSASEALMIDQIESTILTEKIVKGHYTILARRFHPENNESSRREKCANVVRILNRCYVEVQGQIIREGPCASSGNPKVAVGEKVYVQLDEFTISCQHEANFSIYGHPDHIALWKEAIVESEEFPPPHVLGNAKGIQFGDKANDSVFISLYNSGSILIQGVMAILYGMEKLEAVHRRVSDKTKGASPDPAKWTKLYSNARKHFPMAEPSENLLVTSDSLTPTEHHTIDQHNPNGCTSNVSLDMITDLDSWDGGEDTCTERSGRNVWAELQATKHELALAFSKISSLESTIMQMEKDNKAIQSTFGPKLADAILRMQTIEKQMTKPVDQVSSRPSYAEVLPVSKEQSPSRSPGQTPHLNRHPRPTSNRDARDKPRADRLQFEVEKNLVIHDIRNLAAIKGDDMVRKEIGKICSTAIVDTISRSHPTNPKIFVQFRKQESVGSVISNWNFQTFGGSKVRKPMPKPQPCSGVARGVPLDIPDDDLLAAVQTVCPGASTKRLTTMKNGTRTPLHVVKIIFTSPTQLKDAIAHGLLLSCPDMGYNISVGVEAERFRRSVIQCYKCYKFGHIAINCVNAKVCRDCGSGDHSGVGQCSASQVVCVNCNGDHTASNWHKCQVYKQAQARLDMRHVSNSQNG